MIIDETTERTQNAEVYAAKRYSAHAAEQREILEWAYNAASTREKIAASKRQASRVTCKTTIPALDYVKRVARLYVEPMTPTTLRELDHETTQIAIMGFKAIACVGLFLVFLAMTIG